MKNSIRKIIEVIELIKIAEIIEINRHRYQPLPLKEFLEAQVKPELLAESLSCHQLCWLTSQLEAYSDMPSLLSEKAQRFWTENQTAYTKIIRQGAAQVKKLDRENNRF